MSSETPLSRKEPRDQMATSTGVVGISLALAERGAVMCCESSSGSSSSCGVEGEGCREMPLLGGEHVGARIAARKIYTHTRMFVREPIFDNTILLSDSNRSHPDVPLRGGTYSRSAASVPRGSSLPPSHLEI